VRRAYADWTRFDEDRRTLTRHHVELIEIPQRMGSVRKNAADIKMAVDAIELCFERDYITTFVLATGDSDFTPLVHKLRELNRRVIGIGVEASTSSLLPPACDEFLFYERLDGVDLTPTRTKPSRGGRGRAKPAAVEPEPDVVRVVEPVPARDEQANLAALVTRTLAGIERSTGGVVLASQLKRALLRKDPTFNETTYGFRSFGELLRHLEAQRTIEVIAGTATGDPDVRLPAAADEEQQAFEALHATVVRLAAKSGPPHLSGLKTQIRRAVPEFSEKQFGYGGFLQFCKAARTRGLIEMEWDATAEDYVVRPIER
jgi:hypothetical protein